MTIDIQLSKFSIANAIREIEKVKENIAIGIAEFVDVACQDGADTANEAYGGMATAYGHREAETDDDFQCDGHIKVTADDEDKAIIAEFGAGYATMEYHPWAGKFESLTGIPIEVASYSQAQYPYGLFYITNDLRPGQGYWIWGWARKKNGVGTPMILDRVEPRHGLLNARDYIYWNGTDIAREVIRL